VIVRQIPGDFPDHATHEREHFGGIGMRSGIALPIDVGGAVVCVLSFGSFLREREWPSELVSRVQLAGTVFGNAIARRQVKRRLKQKQSELEHVGRVAAMGELASVIAHELDQPLTAVVSNAQAIRYMLEGDDPDLGEVDEALKDVIDGAMRVSEIVRRERRLLRKSEKTFAAVDLNELIREIELFIRAEARQDGTKVSLELVPGLPPIYADRVQVQQVMLNLGRNALQAMRDQPRELRTLRIRTRSRVGEVEASVSDTGTSACDDAQLKRMFEPFYTTKPGGLGMGLSISKSIIEGHHGRISVTRNPTGGGLTFHVALPRAKATGGGDGAGGAAGDGAGRR
jgi:C4-dicarboxylate-specific signal transduction histidine kinase